MRAIIERDVFTRRVGVWFYLQTSSGSVVARRDSETGEWGWAEEIPAGTDRPNEPSLVLHEDMLEQLVAVASETMPPDRAQGRHLDDALAVRDRLLALVELTWKAT